MIIFVSLMVIFVFTFPVWDTGDSFFVGKAEAVRGRRGRPAYRGSAAGVHHRTRRRTIRRRHRRQHYYRGTAVIGTRVTVLPARCAERVVGGYIYYYCDTVYYQPYYEGNSIVYIIVEDPYR
jgi:hypothetical protein